MPDLTVAQNFPQGKKGFRSRLTRKLKNVPWPVVLLILVLGYLTVFPIGVLVWGSLREAPPGVAGPLTIANYVKALHSSVFYRASYNSLVFALLSAILTATIGTLMAWVVERTNAPLRWLMWSLIMFPLLEPGILKAVSWILLLSPKAGMINVFFQNYFGIGPVFNVYSMPGMVWMEMTAHLTLPFLLMGAAFRSMDPSLEEASMASGGSIAYTLRRVTLPLMLPAFLSTFLLLFMRGLEDFEVPALAGIPAGIPIFSAQIWLEGRVSGNFNMAATYSMAYLVISGFALFLYHRATGFAERFSTISGKNFRPTKINLRSGKWPVSLACLFVMFITVVMPLLVLIYASLLPFYQAPTLEIISKMSLKNYSWILTATGALDSLWNNIVVGFSSASVAMLLAAVISWITIRSTLPGRKLLDFIAFAPIAFPGVVLGMALIWTYLTIPIPIYGTILILIIGFIAKYMPFGIRTAHASMLQVHKELEEASTVSGASFGRTFFKITLPLITPGLLSGFIYIFSLTFKVLSLPVLLISFNTNLLSTLIFSLYDNGHYTRLAALGVMMMFILIIISGLSSLVASRFGVKGGDTQG